MFVYVEDTRGTTHLVNTDHIRKCTKRRQSDNWHINLGEESGLTVSAETFTEFTRAIEPLIKG